MNSRVLAALGAVMASLALPPAADAHRLDEYLQASRISIERDRIAIELDLTPGVAVAPEVQDRIDLDGDGRLSAREGQEYARQVAASLGLTVDGNPVDVRMIDARLPDAEAFGQGIGTIRLQAEAVVAAAGGRHQLSYVNAHEPVPSVYLVNPLVPADPGVRIRGLRRDAAQHALTLDYEVAGTGWPRAASLAAGLAAVGLLIAARRRAPASAGARP